ncbi:unnamed protein product [Owenia fusiformis]|uniref:Uncharacterized protein n=1 Tax=Owenia fusiformis TaxID=6347 RepID=A0A8S4PPJ1_OWEFU|nr:unnamed protein product [Owenia fusiformis]
MERPKVYSYYQLQSNDLKRVIETSLTESNSVSKKLEKCLMEQSQHIWAPRRHSSAITPQSFVPPKLNRRVSDGQFHFNPSHSESDTSSFRARLNKEFESARMNVKHATGAVKQKKERSNDDNILENYVFEKVKYAGDREKETVSYNFDSDIATNKTSGGLGLNDDDDDDDADDIFDIPEGHATIHRPRWGSGSFERRRRSSSSSVGSSSGSSRSISPLAKSDSTAFEFQQNRIRHESIEEESVPNENEENKLKGDHSEQHAQASGFETRTDKNVQSDAHISIARERARHRARSRKRTDSEDHGASLRSSRRGSNVSDVSNASKSSTSSNSSSEGSKTFSTEHFRICIMGGASVGKSSIISQFLYDKFLEDYNQTVEDFYRGEYEIYGHKMILDIIDTSGAFSFPAMRNLSIQTSDAFILVYAVDNPQSFEEVKALRTMIMEERIDGSAPVVIVGNKADIGGSKRKVSTEDVYSIATDEWSHGYVEASAKENQNIVGIFKEVLIQSNIQYALSPAVTRRRQSMPADAHKKQIKTIEELKKQRRNTTSCTIS